MTDKCKNYKSEKKNETENKENYMVYMDIK